MNVFLEKPTVEFCEKAGKGFIARPFYAYSNLGYIFISLFILKKARDNLAWYFASTSALIGVLSFIYDTFPRRGTQLMDLAGMYFFVSLLMGINIVRIFRKDLNALPLLCLPLIITGMIFTFLLKGISGNIIFGIYILIYSVLEIFLTRNKIHVLKRWLLAFGLFVFGFAIWIFDFLKIYCMPGNIINGRGIFHFITAYVIYLLFNYYSLNKNDFGLK